MIKSYLNKGISTPIAIGIVLILVIIVGTFTWLQYGEIRKEETDIPEVEIPEDEMLTVVGKLVQLDHPFSGRAVLSKGEPYYLEGDKALEIINYEEGSIFEIVGIVSERERTIPEAGDFSVIKIKVIEVSSYKLLEEEDETADSQSCSSDSDCSAGYWCWWGPCEPPPGGCEENICIKDCNTDNDCEGDKECKLINLFEGGDVTAGSRRGCVRSGFYYIAY